METKPSPVAPTASAEDRPVERAMPVDAEGHAVGATLVVYASGRAQLVAYYATCLLCPSERYPFYSPSERDAWAEAHRADKADHPVELTVGPWDFTCPPWVAATGQPLTPPRSDAVNTFPLPDYDAETLERITRRRAQYEAGCPRHAESAMEFKKEVLAGANRDEMHLSAAYVYACGCFVTVMLDVDAEPLYPRG